MTDPRDKEALPSGVKTRLPALGTPELSVAYLAKIKETVETLAGQRGDAWDRAVTFRDLFGDNVRLGERTMLITPNANSGFPVSQAGNSLVSQIEAAIRASAAFKELQRKIGSVDDLAIFPEEIRSQLSQAIALIAQQRQADIRTIEQKVQTSSISMASQLREVTAGLENASAGVRHLDAAFASQTGSLATSVTQVSARLDNAGGTGVTVEEKFIAQADQITGLLGQWSVKIQAGTDANPVIAGISLSVEDPEADGGTSSFVVLADKFGVFTSGGAVNPFGVDASGAYINGTLRVNAGGTTLDSLGASNLNYIGEFASAPTPSGQAVNDIYRNSSDGNTYIIVESGGVKSWSLWLAKGATGATGATGSTGATGTRGTVQIAASGHTTWSDSAATTAISAAGYGSPVNRDQVTLYGTGFSQTRYYSAGSWLTISAYINGNMLVTGTLAASQLVADEMIGLVYKTASSGQRVTINEGGNNRVDCKDSSGNILASFGGTTSGLVYSNVTGGSLFGAVYGANSGPYPAVNGISSSTAASSAGGYFRGASGYGIDVGSTSGNAIQISSGANGIVQTGGGFNFLRGINPGVDNTYSLGTSGTYRWTALYAMSATITTSDIRTKADIEDSPLGLAFVNDLRPIRYKMIVGENVVIDNFVEVEAARTETDDQGNEIEIPAVIENQPIVTPRAGTRHHFGLPAQQLRETLLAHGQPDAAMWCLSDKNDPDSQQAVRYEELIAPLIRAVQELSAQVVSLQNEVAVLKSSSPA